MRKAIRIAFSLFAFMLTLSAFASNYTFTGEGSWTNVNNWKNGLYPGRILHQGDSIIVEGSAVMGICATYPEVECEDVWFDNYGTIIVAATGSLTLRNQNQFSNGGAVLVIGTLVNETRFQAFNVGSITIWGTFKNLEWIGNQGTITIESGGKMENSRIFDNKMFEDAQGTLVIKGGGILENKENASMNLGAISQNEGTIINASVSSSDINSSDS